jgi:hypothetical protein
MLHESNHQEYEYDANASTTFDSIGNFAVPEENQFTVITEEHTITIHQRFGGRIRHLDVIAANPPLDLSPGEKINHVIIEEDVLRVGEDFHFFWADGESHPDPLTYISKDAYMVIAITGTLRKIRAHQEQSA